MKKWAHKLNREFSKEEVQMASKYMRKCLISLVIKEMQIKTTLSKVKQVEMTVNPHLHCRFVYSFRVA
jgi:ribosomal protein L17